MEKCKNEWARVVSKNLYQTAGINNAIVSDIQFAKTIMGCISKYAKCDWGDTCSSDWKMNDRAFYSGDDRIVAKYVTDKGNIFIITEWDRSATTILFASEY